MRMFRIKVYLPCGRHHYTGLFASSWEAQEQTRAEWPEALRISVLRLDIGRRAAA